MGGIGRTIQVILDKVRDRIEKFVREGEERRATITSVQMHHDGDYIVLYIYAQICYIYKYIYPPESASHILSHTIPYPICLLTSSVSDIDGASWPLFIIRFNKSASPSEI